MLLKKDAVVYETFTKSDSPMKYTLTVVHPGTVGKEFFMTKGHVHGNKTEEFYILLEGKGKLVLQKAGKVRVVDLKKGKIALIKPGEAHRLVNTGNKDLKVHTIYHEDSRPNYSVKFRKIFMKK
jgi:glucose-6-phosphate isomerase